MKTLILCGGVGTRLWPLSTPQHAKQFIPIFDNRSLLECVIERNKEISEEVHLVINQNQFEQAKKLLTNSPVTPRYHLEKEAKNTAPAIILSLLSMEKNDVVLVSPSDHLISPIETYQESIREGMKLLNEYSIITFGIIPKSPHTGYGYIEYQGNKVTNFKEKPDSETADKYIQSGNYLWNSGMFLFKVGSFLDDYQKYNPEQYAIIKSAHQQREENENIINFNNANLDQIEKISIDFALLEKSQNIGVVPVDYSWSDVGSYQALHEIKNKDDHQNSITSNEALVKNAKNNFIFAPNKKVALMGVEDLVVVETEGEILITNRKNLSLVKDAASHYNL